MSKKKIIFIVGTTASGKTNLSFHLIKNIRSSCLVNCDSLQVYDGLDIGSAKPTTDELTGTSHYLFSEVQKGDEFTAGRFRKRALEIIETTNYENYIFVGGSGFYIHALLNGMFEEAPVKLEAKAEVKQYLDKVGPSGLYQLLLEKDPVYAKKIHANDTYRVGRALELVLSIGKSMEQIRSDFENMKTKLPHPYLFLGTKLEREVLRHKVGLRLEQMIAGGFKEEVEGLLAEGLAHWKPLSSVGYKEMFGLINGLFSLTEFKQEVIKNTMRLAKRQMTWFKRNPEIHWLNSESSGHLDQGMNIVNDFLRIIK